MTPDQRLIAADWLQTATGNRLHHATLTDAEAVEIIEQSGIDDLRLSCGRVTRWACIPGLFTRMGADRCRQCCRATGMPPGTGSPKNDPACKAVSE